MGGNQTYTITNYTGYIIDDVKVDGGSVGAVPSYPFKNVDNNHNISATFKPVTLTHTIVATAGTGGSISPSGNVIVKDGENQTFNITPNNCYDIQDVLVDSVSVGPVSSYPFTNVTKDHTINATFHYNQVIYTINATAGPGGKISPSGSITVNCGENKTFTMIPDINYKIGSVIVDGLNIGVINPYKFSDISGNHEIYVTFVNTSGPYIINATADKHTIVYPPGIRSYPEGANKTYLTQSKPGSDLTDVLVDYVSKGPNQSWTFTNIISDHNISTYGDYTPGQVQVFFSANQTYGPAPLTVQFTDQSVGNPTKFYWQFGDGGISDKQNPLYTYMTPGTYSVSLRATNDMSGGLGVWTNAITVTDGVVPIPPDTFSWKDYPGLYFKSG